MALTDISLLFKDIIETPQQKAARLAREGQAAAGQYTGLPTGLRELAMGTASRIPGTVESIRQFGASVGLPVQTQGEQLQRSMGGLNITDPTDQAEMVRLLANLGNPESAAMAAAIFEEDRKTAALAKEQSDLAALQSKNIQSLIDARDAEEFSRVEEETRLGTEREKSRIAMNEFIIAADLNDNEKQLYINYVNSGNADAGGLKELAPMINREEEIKVIGNAAKVKNRVTGEWEWDVPPEMDSQTGYIDTSPIQYNPASIARYNRKFADIRRRENDGTINQEEAWAEKANAANLLLARAESGYKYVEVPRQIGEETVITYQEIPANPKTIQDTRAELSAINERNRSLNDLSNNAIGKVGSIRSLVEGAVGETGIDTGSVWAAMFAYKPGTDEWTLRKDIDTLNADLGLTGLQEARMGSSSGASGFGQLTQTEMAILQERLAAISFGLSTEDFLENLAIIETYFKRAAQRSSTTLSYDQFIGIKNMPEVIEEVNR